MIACQNLLCDKRSHWKFRNSTSKKYTPKGQNKKKIPQESITQNKFQISLLLQKETKKAQLT